MTCARPTLILGAAVWPGGQASPTLRRRTETAAGLWHRNLARPLIPCGGLGQHGPTEARVMADLLLGLGVPGSEILLEDRSTNTAQNIGFALPLLGDATDIRIVTDIYHAPRARLVARRAGLRAVTHAPPLRTARLWPQLKGAAREAPALVAYALGLRG